MRRTTSLPALAVATVAGALATGCGGSSSGAGPPPASPPATVTTTATPTPTASSPPPGGGSDVGAAVSSAGTTLTPPGAPTTKRVGSSSDDDCYGLLDHHFNEDLCTQFHSKLGTAVVLIENQGHQERDLVYRLKGSHAELALRRIRHVSMGTQGNFPENSTDVMISDLADDNTPKAILLVPTSGSDTSEAYDDLDVVEASGTVVIHQNLHGGVARKAFGGGLETYTPAGAGKARHRIIRYRDSAWHIVLDNRVSSSHVPDDTF